MDGKKVRVKIYVFFSFFYIFFFFFKFWMKSVSVVGYFGVKKESCLCMNPPVSDAVIEYQVAVLVPGEAQV